MQHPVDGSGLKPERAVRCGLRRVQIEAQRSRQRHATEACIDDVPMRIQIDDEQHVRARPDHIGRHVPEHPRGEVGDRKAERAQGRAE